MITLGIIEDLEDYRNLLTVLFNNTPGTEIFFSVPSAEAAIEQIRSGIKPEICIVDIQLPGKSGIELLGWIDQHAPGTLCLICTAYDTDEKLFQSLEAGAHGYILKSTSPAAITETVKELHHGGSPMSSEIARKVVTAFSRQHDPGPDILSEREKQVLEMLSQGLLYKEVAGKLLISIETVKRHCFNIYRKLHVNNRTEAINKFLKC